MTIKWRTTIHRALDQSISEVVTLQRLLPDMLARAAGRRGLDIPGEEIARVASALIQATGEMGDTMQIDLDLPCGMGSDEVQVQATLQILVDELAQSLPREVTALSDAVSESVLETIQDVAAFVAGEITLDAVGHARRLAKAQSDRAQQVQRLWGPAFERLDLMRHLVAEWSATAVELGKGAYARPSTAHALEQLAERAYEVAGDIVELARAGYADGALARWRSLHEICVVAMFLAKRTDRCADMYLWHHKIEELQLLGIDRTDVKSSIKNLRTDRYASDLQAQRASLVAKFGSAFVGDYGWAAVELGLSKTNFRSLEEQVGLEILRHGYKRANSVVHGGALATLTRVSIGAPVESKAGLPPAYGCEVAANYTVSSLAMLVASLCADTEDADLLALVMVIQQCASDVRAMIKRSQERISVNSPRARLRARNAERSLKRTKVRPSFRR